MSPAKAVFGLLFGLLLVGGIAAAIFLGIQYSRESSQNDGLLSRIESLEGKINTLENENKSLDFLYRGTIKRNDELAGEKIELQRKLLVALINNTVLENKIKDLKKEIQRISQPPVSPDASTPWERLQLSHELWAQGNWDAYWDLLNSEFKTRCPKEQFVLLLVQLNPPRPESIFVDQAMGNGRAMVWAFINGKLGTQLFLLEGGRWMIYAGNKGC